MKVLILHPEFKNPGGVSGYYSALKNNFSIDVTHFEIGRRIDENGLFKTICRAFKDYFLFIRELKHGKYDIVHINPSLDFKSVFRDGIFVLLSKYYKRRVLVFFHGWDKVFEREMKQKTLWLFQFMYGKTDVFIVLATEFKSKLSEWGFNQPIYVETTAVDEDLVKGLDIQTILEKRFNNVIFTILFLARIIKEKGIYETIDAVNLLQSKYSNIELIVAGDGEELQRVKDYVRVKNISRVIFTGYMRGDAKKSSFEKTHIYCFPTYYGEGNPVSVLEALAFGLPVITRPVGGIADFFEQGKHGFITESKDASVIVSYIEKLYLDRELYKNISLYNYHYAKERFWASTVTKRLEKTYADVLCL